MIFLSQAGIAGEVEKTPPQEACHAAQEAIRPRAPLSEENPSRSTPWAWANAQTRKR